MWIRGNCEKLSIYIGIIYHIYIYIYIYIYMCVTFSKYNIYVNVYMLMYISELCFVSYRAVRIKICLKDNLLHNL